VAKCKLIINKLAGNSQKTEDMNKILDVLTENYNIIDTVYIDENNNVKMRDEIVGYDALAVCGGDGTLNSAINAVRDKNIRLIFMPCGTLNDKSKSMKLAKKYSGSKKIRRFDIGKVGDTMFAYVFAGGTFSPIGYQTKRKDKKRFKRLAYFSMIFREYKVHRIRAKIGLENRTLQDVYTLLMVVNSHTCFGFNFNKMHVHNDGKAQLLLIKAPKSDGFLGRLKIFFPFFRAFFIGFRHEVDKKNLKFITIRCAELDLDGKYTFTVDGEKLDITGKHRIEILRQKLNLIVY